MKRHIEEEINALKEKILSMASIAEEMISLSVRCFLERKDENSQKIFEREENVNKLQMENDERSVKILALYQPEAGDLRTIMAATKINAELERIADQAVNITQTCHYHLLKEMPIQTMEEIPQMAVLSQEMIRESIDAFARRDVELAQSVLRKDERVDTLKAKVLNEIIGLIPLHPDHAKQLVDLILISKNIEKIADHATNIAEDVIFMVLGKDIRHHTSPIQ